MRPPETPSVVLALVLAATAAGCGFQAGRGDARPPRRASFGRLLGTRLEFRQLEEPVGTALTYEQYLRPVEPGPAPRELRPFLQRPSSLSFDAYLRGEASDLRLRGERWRGRSGLHLEGAWSELLHGPSEHGRCGELAIGWAQFVEPNSRYAVVYRLRDRIEDQPAVGRAFRYVDHIVDVTVSCALNWRGDTWLWVSGGPRVSILQRLPGRLDLRLEAALYFGGGASPRLWSGGLRVRTDIELYLLTAAKHVSDSSRLHFSAGAVGDEAVGELGLEWRF